MTKITIEITNGIAHVFYDNGNMSNTAHFLAAYESKNKNLASKQEVLERVSAIIEEHRLM